MNRVSRILAPAAAAVLLSAGLSTPAAAQDVDAAKALVQSNNCTQCHGIKKDKDAPAFLKIAEKYKGKAGAEDELIKHITSGKKVKLADGSQEDHKIVKTIPANDQAQMRNLIKWILATQ
ncbi:MAG TPA: c-type cytochrome [Burkholderiaceae bacterium]|nr:c-type cytochrome [Burkholderiaceae bacterium]